MSVLRVIRHGQASYFADDYDQLSPLGEEQGRALGRHWLDRDQAIDCVVVGPRRRHRQTLEAVASVFRQAGREWPEAREIPELDEHSGQEVVHQTLPGWIEDNMDARPEVVELLAERPPSNLRLYFHAFREITRRWALGDLPTPDGLESWDDFRRRVNRGLERIIADLDPGKTIAVFTSGGPVATSAGLALGLSDEKVVELSWRVRNTSYVDLLFSDDGLALDSFNVHPHLGESKLVTYI